MPFICQYLLTPPTRSICSRTLTNLVESAPSQLFLWGPNGTGVHGDGKSPASNLRAPGPVTPLNSPVPTTTSPDARSSILLAGLFPPIRALLLFQHLWRGFGGATSIAGFCSKK